MNEWKDQQLRWKHFEDWENEQLRSRPLDFPRALAWMSDAWELAGSLDPRWGSRENAEAHWQYLAEIQDRLNRAFP